MNLNWPTHVSDAAAAAAADRRPHDKVHARTLINVDEDTISLYRHQAIPVNRRRDTLD